MWKHRSTQIFRPRKTLKVFLMKIMFWDGGNNKGRRSDVIRDNNNLMVNQFWWGSYITYEGMILGLRQQTRMFNQRRNKKKTTWQHTNTSLKSKAEACINGENKKHDQEKTDFFHRKTAAICKNTDRCKCSDRIRRKTT